MKNFSLILICLLFPTSLRVFSDETLTQNPPLNLESNLVSGPMNKLQVAQIIAAAGFPKHVVPLITCLAEHESHFQPNAVNENTNHSRDYGLLQINSVWLQKDGCNTNPHKLLDPVQNAQCAYKIYKTQGLTAWTTYKTFRNTCLAYRVNEFNYEDLADAKIENVKSEGLM